MINGNLPQSTLAFVCKDFDSSLLFVRILIVRCCFKFRGHLIVFVFVFNKVSFILQILEFFYNGIIHVYKHFIGLISCPDIAWATCALTSS